MDRNQITGLVLITVLFTIYIIFFSPDQNATPPPITDSSKASTPVTLLKRDSAAAQQETSTPDSILQKQRSEQFGSFAALAVGTEKEVILENNEIKVALSTKGGTVKRVWLKNYSSFTDFMDKKNNPIQIIDESNNSTSLKALLSGKQTDLYQLYYTPSEAIQGENKIVVMRADAGNGRIIEHEYILGKSGFVLQYRLHVKGLQNELANQPLTFEWNQKIKNFERDPKQNSIATTVNYYTQEDGFDQLSETSTDPESDDISQVKWVALKQKFFNTAIISDGSFSKGQVKSEPSNEMVISSDEGAIMYLKKVNASLNIEAGDVLTDKASFKYYFGPNHYNTCKEVTDGFEKNVYLGWPVINVINRFIVIPVFNFFESFIGNYGIIIVILVILLKLVLFPLSWKSYVSMAKMRVLKPEQDEIKAKYEGNTQKIQSETMLLYQKVGVNPMSGCIPVLLQMPIILAMFNFFPNSIELRQQAFWWAPDLSTYDTVISWTGDIPVLGFLLGNHLSLFTLLMTISTLAYTWFNNQISTAATGPMIAVSYVMPVVFLFVLNSFPAGLSFYYLVSNIISIVQQLIIRRMVDESAIRAQLEVNRQKIASGEVKKNRFMSRLEDAMKQQEAKKKKK